MLGAGGGGWLLIGWLWGRRGILGISPICLLVPRVWGSRGSAWISRPGPGRRGARACGRAPSSASLEEGPGHFSGCRAVFPAHSSAVSARPLAPAEQLSEPSLWRQGRSRSPKEAYFLQRRNKDTERISPWQGPTGSHSLSVVPFAQQKQRPVCSGGLN